MKLMVASDLHGSLFYTTQLKEAFDQEAPRLLLLLGDLLYHGPRNDLPKGYDPKGVAALLNDMKGFLLCVRGNCEAEVDQMMLEFPVLSDYAALFWEDRTLFAVHGHQPWLGTLPVRPGNVLLTGHTHVPVLQEKAGILRLNPGSVSIPKEGSGHSYLILENQRAVLKNLDGSEITAFDLSRLPLE